MSKFKVGDRVRILDGSKIKNYVGGWYKFMEGYVDTITTISSVYRPRSGKIGYKCHDAGGYILDGRGLERCGNETIVIYRKDNEVVSLDKRTGKKAIAKCSPEDTFDFNIGAKLAFDRLINSNKNTTVLGNGFKEVNRHAKIGEYIKIVDAFLPYGHYKNGDILQIVDDTHGYARYGHKPNEVLYDEEYVVLEGYKPDKYRKKKETHKFKVGDIVKGNSKSDRRYNITNSDMTMGKITEVSEDGKFIDVEMLEHKRNCGCDCGCGGKFCGLESKYFDLVEEAPKLYNGKIIFTNGDDTFKTGHIYEVKDGRINTAGLFIRVSMVEPFKDIEDVKDYFTGDWDGNRKRKIGWSAYTLELMEVKED